MNRATRPLPISAISWSKLIGALLDGPCTVKDLVEASGLSDPTVRFQIRAMKKDRNIYIAAWEPDARGRHNVRVYALGRRADVRKPPPKYVDNAARLVAYRQRRDAKQLQTWLHP